MRIDELVAAVAARGAELAEYCHRLASSSASAKELIVDRFGVRSTTAGQWLSLGAALFGPLSDAKEKSLRSRSVAVATDLGLSVDALLVINTALRYRHPEAPFSREELRLELVTASAGLSVDAIKAMANARVREVNEGLEVNAPPSRRYFRASRSSDARGMRYAALCLPEADMAALVRTLTKAANKLRAGDRNLTHQQAMVDALVSGASGNGENPWLQPAVLMSMDDLEGRGDGTFATTDGTLITAAEYAAQKLAPYGLCLVYDNDAQPVDLFRIQRTWNDKQRAMISLDQLLCGHYACTHTAATGQGHHVTAWADGGMTNLSNLVGACATHNARNDDNPATKRNGRLERCPDTGRVGWRPPGGGPLRFNPSPIMSRSGRAWALSKVGAR